MVFLLNEELSEWAFQRRRRLDLLEFSKALLGVALQQVGLPNHEVVPESLGRFRLDGENVFPPLFDLLFELSVLVKVIDWLVRVPDGEK